MVGTDQVLVQKVRAGDRDAFAQIVQRYQTMICSIALGVTGSLGTSEELAQETFLVAWRSLDSLREPDRLRPWLVGIVRNLARNASRQRYRDVLSSATAIADEAVTDANAVDPASTSMEQDDFRVLESTLAGLPPLYREPLILYYREQQSVEQVAEHLELSPEAVKKRLTRGRELLREEVAARVERSLARSAPGRAFTLGVLAALPVLTGTAKAATASVTASKSIGVIKGISAMNAAGWTGWLGMIAGPIVGLLGGWFGYSMSMKAARSDQERTFIRRMTAAILILIGIMAIGISFIVYQGRTWATTNPRLLVMSLASLVIGYMVALVSLILFGNYRIRKIREADGTQAILAETANAKLPAFMRSLQYPRRYESRTRILGLPLVSVHYHGALSELRSRRQAAVGWIALGDIAYGVLFASGNVAVGGIAVGALCVGLVSLGGCALGLLALGGAAIGWWSIGGVALGMMAFAGISVAWRTALGGFAMAHHFAVGGIAIAREANTEMAKSALGEHPFFDWGSLLMTPWSWLALVAVAVIPVILAHRCVTPVGRELEER